MSTGGSGVRVRFGLCFERWLLFLFLQRFLYRLLFEVLPHILLNWN